MPLINFVTIILFGALVQGQRVEIKKLNENPGILPLRLGKTRVQQTYHTFIHNYPLEPIKRQLTQIEKYIKLMENKLEKLKITSKHVDMEIIKRETYYLRGQIDLIHPDILNNKNNRTKRGIINALGSVFKFISGNLDASDGERYDKTIKELSDNQHNIISYFNKQLSMNRALIKSYQENMKNISHNFNQILSIVPQVQKEMLNEAIDMIRITIIELRDVVNSIHTAVSFATLNKLHMSIITEMQINEMMRELKNHNDESTFYSSDNILFTKTIEVDFYITPEHIVFLLHVPLLDRRIFQLYHLYSVPTSQNTTIIAPTPYVAMTENAIYYLKEKCGYLQQEYYCASKDLQKNFQQDSCIRNLLQVKKSPECKQVPISINDTLVETINDQKYLIILPSDTLVHTKCGNEEVHKLQGVYLLNLPFSCSFITKDFVYQNLQGEIKEDPVYLPPLPFDMLDIKPIHLNLKSINLDELSKLTLDTNDPLMYLSTSANTWIHSGLPLYALLIVTIILVSLYFLWKTYYKPKNETKTLAPEEVKLQAFPTPVK